MKISTEEQGGGRNRSEVNLGKSNGQAQKRENIKDFSRERGGRD